MGRPESKVSGTDPRLCSFATDLRQLRERAGSPSYRQLAQQAHYSTSTLSQAANGRAMPTLEVTLAFVRACGGDVAEWERRWHELNDVDPASGEGQAEETAQAAAPAPPRAFPRYLLLGSALATVVVVIAVTVFTFSHVGAAGPVRAASPSPRLQPGAVDPVADGSDPGRAGCGLGAVTMATVRVHFPVDQLSGQIELRYSPHCRTAWGRFEPATGWNPGQGTMVTVWTIRPADQATQSYTVEYGG